MLTFKECTLAKLDKTFGLRQKKIEPVLEEWLNGEAPISELERQVLLLFQEKLITNVHDWNETELAYNFIGPVLTLVDYTTDNCNFFAERFFGGVVDGVEMQGKPDGMIASGVREPEQPYFCFQEYKKFKDPDGDPAGQALGAMLVAQEINEHHHPIYGGYVLGNTWYFMTLQNKTYCTSMGHLATRESDLFDIFRILRVLKQRIVEFIKEDTGK